MLSQKRQKALLLKLKIEKDKAFKGLKGFIVIIIHSTQV